MLAQGYGHPQVFSGFTWNSTDDSPPSDANGMITDTSCSSGQWTCTHRNPGVLGMVGWHNYVGTDRTDNFWTDGNNVIAFSKGNRGWATFNNGSAAQTITVQTGLPQGRYCNVLEGRSTRSSCANGGAPVVVNGRVSPRSQSHRSPRWPWTGSTGSEPGGQDAEHPPGVLTRCGQRARDTRPSSQTGSSLS